MQVGQYVADVYAADSDTCFVVLGMETSKSAYTFEHCTKDLCAEVCLGKNKII